MRKGLTSNIESIIDQVAQLDCVKNYTLCGGTALAIQLGHRISEDLDFMMWRISKEEKPEVDWPNIEQEIQDKIGPIEHRDILGFDQVMFVVKGVKISFFVSNNFSPVNERIPYQGNIVLADIPSVLAMKIEVMLRRMKYRDYYDIYSIVQSGFSLKDGIGAAVKYSGFKLSTKAATIMLSSNRIATDANFQQMQPIHDVTVEQMRNYLIDKLK